MFKRQLVLIISSSLFLLISFQNCSKTSFKPVDTISDTNQNANSTALADETSTVAGTAQNGSGSSTNTSDRSPSSDTSPSNTPPSTSPPPGTSPIEVVQNSCNTGNRQKLTKSFFFPKPASTCDWSKNGNLAPRNQYFQARIEEEGVLDLPPNTIICDMKFNFAKQQFLYDDHFLMTFNSAVIASSYNFDKVLTTENNLLRYDWSKMAGMYWDSSKEGKYCATGGICNWPVTDTPGNIEINYDASVFQKIMSEDINRNEHSLKFISIGDNDELDCEHSDIRFSIDVEFVGK